jgi:hypothetical protein
MTRHAREAVSLALATALGEAALVGLVTTDWSNVGGQVLLFAFLVGPLVFLAVLAWRRRTHPGRSRLFFVLAVLCAVGGLGVLGFNLYRFYTDEGFRRSPNMSRLLVPIVQWALIGSVWLGLVIQEAREKRAAQNMTNNPSQSA